MYKTLPPDAAPARSAALFPAISTPPPPPPAAAAAPPLPEVLWRRRWTVSLCACLCAALAAAYLMWATPVYQSVARVSIEQYGPRVSGESQGVPALSEGFLQTEADAMQSGPVIRRALDAIGPGARRTLAEVRGDPVEWLKRSGALKVEVSRKSDVITVAMESPYPAEAAKVANAVVAAYVAEVSQQKQSTGGEIVRVLQDQHDQLVTRRDARLARMSQLKRDHRVLSFKDDRTNPTLERAAALSTSLTGAEIATIEIKAQRDAIAVALANPAALSAFVESQQLKVKESGDKEYDELRSQLGQSRLALSTAEQVEGPNHPRVGVLRSVVATLQQRVAEKERTIAEAQLLAVKTQLDTAEQREREIRGALESQRDAALDLSPAAIEYAQAEADAQQLQKQVDAVDARIAEVHVNAIAARPLNVRVIDPARAAERPVKPNRTLSLAAALMVGLMLGAALALHREQRHARLHSPEEVLARLGMPVIATVPPMHRGLPPAVRGQVMRIDAQSVVAEAYRAVRTALHLGAASEARTVLVASPAQGDGKSTTASNLAIAFAQAGERTLLIDCDLREPVQHMIFQVDGTTGLTTALSGESRLRDAIQPTRVAGLYVLPCGPVPTNPSELLAGKSFKRLMQVLSRTFDRIVIDSPPLMRFTDGSILAAASDVTLLVLRMNQSMRALSELALARLEHVGARVLGTVANDGPTFGAAYYGRSSHYTRVEGVPRLPSATDVAVEAPSRAERQVHGPAEDDAAAAQVRESEPSRSASPRPRPRGAAPDADVLVEADADWSALVTDPA